MQSRDTIPTRNGKRFLTTDYLSITVPYFKTQFVPVRRTVGKTSQESNVPYWYYTEYAVLKYSSTRVLLEKASKNAGTVQYKIEQLPSTTTAHHHPPPACTYQSVNTTINSINNAVSILSS